MPHNGNRLLSTVSLVGGYSDVSLINVLHSTHCIPRLLTIDPPNSYHPTILPEDVITSDGSGTVIGAIPAGYMLDFDQFFLSTVNGDRWIVAFDGTATVSFGLANAYGSGTLTYSASESTPNRRVYIASSYNNAPNNNPPPRGSGTTYSQNYQVWSLCRLQISNVTVPITNLRVIRGRHEAVYNAGQRVTPEFIQANSYLGVCRFMNDMGGNDQGQPGWSESVQIPPKDWLMGFQYYNSDVLRPATKLSENFYEITSLRPGKPTITNKMALQFKAENIAYHRFTLASKGTVTRLTKTNHGFSNGEMIQRILYEKYISPDYDIGRYFGFGGRDVSWDPLGVDTTTGLRAAWPVTVIDANTIEIPYNSVTHSADVGTPIGATIMLMRPMRVKYGATTVYCHSGKGLYHVKQAWNPYQLGAATEDRGSVTHTIVRGVFYAPPNKTTFCFLTGTNRTDQFKHLSWYSDFCNATGTHAWVHPPHLANDELCAYIAAHFRDNLGAGQETVFEIGNEPWNYAWTAFDALDMYQWAAGFSRDVNPFAGWWPGEYPAPPNQLRPDWGGMQINGHEIRACAKAGKAVYPGLKVAVNLQIANGNASSTILYMEGLYNQYAANDRPGHNVDYAAYAPYLNIFPSNPAWPTIINLWKAGQKEQAYDLCRDATIATEYADAACRPGGAHYDVRTKWPHLQYVQYEGGHHTAYNNGEFAGSSDWMSVPGVTEEDLRYWAWEWRRSRQAGEMFAATADKWVSQPFRKWPAQYGWVEQSSIGGNNWGQWLAYSPDPIWSYDIAPSTQKFIEWSTWGAFPNVMSPGSYSVSGNGVNLTYTPAQVQPYYALTKFNNFTRDLGLGLHDFTSHVFKVAFSLATPQVAWTRLSDVPQIGATGGYVAGGYTVTVTWTETAGTGVLKIEDKEITATSDGLSLRYAILYNDTAANDPLIGFYDFGPVTMQETDVLNINFDEAQGALRVQ